jgi:hypothetical protein
MTVRCGGLSSPRCASEAGAIIVQRPATLESVVQKPDGRS